MTADEARAFEGQFGVIEAREDKQNYPHTLYGEVKKVDSYYLLFESTGEQLVLFSLRKIKNFTPKVRRHRLKKLPLGPRVKPKNIRP